MPIKNSSNQSRDMSRSRPSEGAKKGRDSINGTSSAGGGGVSPLVKGSGDASKIKPVRDKLPLKTRLVRWLPLIGVLAVLVATLLYLDVFGFRALLLADQETDPILQVKLPADYVEGRLKAAKAAVLLESVPEPVEGALDLYVRNGSLYIAENGVVRTYNVVGAEAGKAGNGGGGLKLSFTTNGSGLSFLMGRSDTPQYDMLRSVEVGQVRGTPGKQYAAVRAFYTEAGQVPVMRVEDLSLNIQRGAAFTLPKTVEAVLMDGSLAQVPVTWSPSSISTSEAGVLGSVGTVEGYGGNVTLTVIIGESLAATVEAAGGGAGGSLVQESQQVVSAGTSAAGPETVQEAKPTPGPTPAVKPAPVTIQSLRSVTASVKQGEAYVMPTSVVAVMSDRSTRSVSVTWNPSSLDTGSAGTKVSTGAVAGTTQKATLTLTVTQSALAAPGVAVSKISGPDGTVRVTGKAGATVLFNGASVGTLGSGGVLTVSGVNIDTLQTVGLILEGWNPSPAVRTFVLF